MIERITHFLPSMLIIATAAVLTFLYVRILRLAWGKENAMDREWIKTHKWTYLLLFRIPITCAFFPAAEELLFRTPIIIGFHQLSYYAFLGISISGLLFGAGHYLKHRNPITDEKLFGIKDVTFAILVSNKKSQKRKRVNRKWLRFLKSTIGGSIYGYFGIRYQSLYVSVGLHMVSNIILMLFAIFLIVKLRRGVIKD